jgi:hypothetical protein
MTEENKNNFVKYMLIYFCVFGIMTVVVGFVKTANLFYHQVIIKDQIAGELIKR